MIHVYSDREVKRIRNFWGNIHFHPTDAAEDHWGRRILDSVADDKIARYVRLYVMTEDIVDSDENGNLIYDFSESDRRLDYMVEKGFDLLLCFAYMPTCIASDKMLVSDFLRYKGKRINISQPTDYSLWSEVCRRCTEHFIERYGRERVERWYFHCWNEPDIEIFWMKGCTDPNERVRQYCALYDAFADGVRAVSEKIRIGGPSVAVHMNFLRAFLRHIREKQKETPNMLDFVSIHTYGEKPEEMAKSNNISPEKTLRICREHRKIVEEEGFHGIEIVVDEWEACAHGFKNENDFPCLAYRNNEKFSAHFFSLIDCYVRRDADISKMMICLSGQHNLKREFEGYRSFFTMSGFKKPIYNAYAAAAMLGNILLECDNEDNVGIIPTKGDDGNVAVALYYTDSRLFRVLPNKPVHLRIMLGKGAYSAEHYRIDRDNSNAYTEWCRCGKPENPNGDQRERIYTAGDLKPWYIDNTIYTDVFEQDILMTPDSVSLIRLTPIR